jgi:hypothetical protein
MTAPKTPITDKDDPIVANPEAVAEIAVRAFGRAKDRAIKENERLGVPSYGTGSGRERSARHRTKTKPTAADLHHK